ncbi:cell division protein FtsX [Aquibaculum sediminis]|uniref:cell division protein FtsX n=1 Tax=Aquibaculum sediminis TaxID=3231907 RepID=UPI003453BFCA
MSRNELTQLSRRDLPLAGDASARFLPWLIAFMVFLAALALVGADALRQTAARWDGGLSGQITVQLPPLVREDAPTAASRAEQAAALLRDLPAVRSAETLDRAEAAALLEPWLGAAANDAALPLPTLITVRHSGDPAPLAAEMRQRLQNEFPDAEVDDHQAWIGGLLNLTRGLEVLALFLLLLVGAAAVVTVVFVTRTGLAVHRPVIELLHLMGARDVQIAGRFQTHALWLGLKGGLLGVAVAALCYGALRWAVAPTTLALLPAFEIGPALLVLLALLPLLAAGIAWLTARITVLRTLGRMP